MKLWPPSGLQNPRAIISSHGGLCRAEGKGWVQEKGKTQSMEKIQKHRLGYS